MATSHQQFLQPRLWQDSENEDSHIIGWFNSGKRPSHPDLVRTVDGGDGRFPVERRYGKCDAPIEA